MQLKHFDVLNPELNLYQKFFVEASAGCGKTFSIENAYVRLLLDAKKPMMPKDILVLTFTREATKELKLRIHKAIEKAIYEIEHPSEATLPYLKDVLSGSQDRRKVALQNLLDSQSSFDQAKIFTLHGFCFRMLKENLFEAKLNIEESFEDEGPSLALVDRVLKDFFNFQLNASLFSSSQVRLLIRHYKGDFQVLMKSSIIQLSKEAHALPFSSFEIDGKKALSILKEIKSKSSIESNKVQSDCHLSSIYYKGGVSREGTLNYELSRAIKRFANLFSDRANLHSLNQFLWDASTLFEFFKSSNLKKRTKQSVDVKLFYPELWSWLEGEFKPLIERMISPINILSHLLSLTQKRYQALLENERTLTPQNILEAFRSLAQNENVAQKIALSFEAVIVDEFQDTDPVQWDILSSIFLKFRQKDYPFYLVGDPKQSIYGFRNADIYTYLRAAESLGVSQRVTLDTNYRSQPDLVDALNHLFGAINNNWIDLPKLNQTLPYHPVKPSSLTVKSEYSDDRGSIHFFMSQEKGRVKSVPSKKIEEEKLFPFILNEILRLNLLDKVPLSHFAILVKDRFQGARLKNFLKGVKVPFQSLRPEPLKGSEIVAYFLMLYKAVLDPKKISYIQQLKLNPLVPPFKPYEEKQLFQLMARLTNMRCLLTEKGISSFYQSLMHDPFEGGQSIYEYILTLDEGLYYYHELEQIKEILIEQEMDGLGAEEIKQFLTELASSAEFADKIIGKRQNHETESVHILTMHMSKGLEFEIVFALGLVSRTTQRDDLIAVEEKGRISLLPSSFSKSDTENYRKDLNAEKLRQLYVTLTRAKQRLYIPYILAEKTDENKSSPIELFYQKLQLDSDSLCSYISAHPSMSYTQLIDSVEIAHEIKRKVVTLVEPKKNKLILRKAYSHSFTSLASHNKKQLRDLGSPHDFDALDKNMHTLPAGKQTGLLYHRIMEHLNFRDKVVNIKPFVENTPYEPWLGVLEEHFETFLKNPFVSKFGSFTLRDLLTSQIFKEVEFLYPVQNSVEIEGCTKQGDFLHGFIDLICLYEGKYYLIDYKTNWLGASCQDYKNVSRVMEENKYFLQAEIYKLALKNYLRLFERRSFDECYGGSFYVFVRGIVQTYPQGFDVATKLDFPAISVRHIEQKWRRERDPSCYFYLQ